MLHDRHPSAASGTRPRLLWCLAIVLPGFLLAEGQGRPVTAGERHPTGSPGPTIASTAWCPPPGDARSFERFVERCAREGREYRLSLAQLAEAASSAQRSGEVPEEVRTLRGINWVIGFAVDRARSDVLILGMHDPGRPLLDIDCLATAVRSVATGRTPACSLDPDGDPRFQKSVILGVDRHSRWAECMIEADYEMKRLAQGYDLKPIVRSYVGRKAIALNSSRGGRLRPGASEVNRWWFTRAEKSAAIRSLIVAEGETSGSADVLLILRSPVVLLTEKQIQGEFGTGEVAREAEQFASAFTLNMEKIGRRYRSIGELLALYRLLDLFVHLEALGGLTLPRRQFWLEEYRSPFAGPPDRLPTLSRTLEWSNNRTGMGYEIRVEGGVNMPIDLVTAPATATTDRTLVRRIIEGP